MYRSVKRGKIGRKLARFITKLFWLLGCLGHHPLNGFHDLLMGTSWFEEQC